MPTLYSLSLSPPARAAQLMLEHKAIEHRVVNLLPGIHPLLLRALGFRRGTVPAIRIGGRRIQGSLEISRALDEIQPVPPLYPGDSAMRAAVAEAERWCERELQPAPRIVLRWGAKNTLHIRRWIAELVGMPLSALAARLNRPVAIRMAAISGADDASVQATLTALPAMLDHVDALIAEGVICGDERNAADFQILTTVRAILTFEDLSAFVAGRPCEAPARALWPDPVEPVPAALPKAWIQAALARSAATA